MVLWEIPMISLIFYIAVLLALGALTVFLLRQKGSYFRSVQILFVIGFLSIASLALFDLIKNFLVRSEGVVLFTSIGGVSAVLIAAIAVEHAHDQKVTSNLRSLFSNHISYRKEGLQIVKLSEPKTEDT
jgi:peptidoglycan/LPS O-acetylase OafA/YrhL